ncbi:hypothetical protein BCR44DRAFT_1438981 [Catenaria anguillulae PL171]|uniref:Dystroglycan-type cadherin-like domain-containing protein n=1 Tax=Catenaria anguillulae PL171 TaxID=765915 RepID=A0A1Y2HEM9_9FUNG|nr:hypothetical protein BCR44DRAFT_1438981 [Catenaria anguillulae PL171]
MCRIWLLLRLIMIFAIKLMPFERRRPQDVASAAVVLLLSVAITLVSLVPLLVHTAPTTSPLTPRSLAAHLTRRAPANPIGWRGEFLVLSLNENSAPSLSGPNDYYRSEGNPAWLVFHSSNRSWTGWVPAEGPSDTQLTFQLVGQVQDRTIRQPMSVTIIKRPQGGRSRSSSPSSGSNTNLSPDFLTAIPLPTSTITPKSPTALINQLAQVFSPTVKVTDVTLSDPALVPPESDTLAVTKLNATYGQLVFWSTPSRTVRWQQVQSGPGSALPTWLAYDAGNGALSGTVPAAHRTALPMPVARDFKRGAIQLTVTANAPPTATGADVPVPKPTQVVVVAPAEPNRAPRLANPSRNNAATGPDDDRAGWTATVRSGNSIRWSVPAGWTQDPDQDATMWVAVQSALGLPKWATWDASQGVLNGRVPRTSTIMDAALVTDWANVSLPLRGAMPPLPWSLSTCMWIAAVDPLGIVSNWLRADIVVDEWVPPTPKVPVYDVPAPAPDGSGGGVVRLNDLFVTNVSSVFEWDGFVGILPSDAPVTLDQDGALIADPIGGNREIVAHVVVVDRKGGVGLVTVRFPKREGAGEDVTMNGGGGGEGSGAGANAGANGQQSVGEFLFDKWFAGVDTSSPAAFFRTAPKNTAVQILSGCILGLMLAMVALLLVVRRRRRARTAVQTQQVLGAASGKGGGTGASDRSVGMRSNGSGGSGGGARRGSGNGLMMSLYNAGASANGSRGSLSQVGPAPVPISSKSSSSSSSATPLRQQQLQQDAHRKSLNRVSFSDTVEASDGTLQRLNQKEGRIGEGLVARSAEEVGSTPLATAPTVAPTASSVRQDSSDHAAPQAQSRPQPATSSHSVPPAPISPATSTTPPCHPPTYPAPAPYLPPNPSATDLSLANAWLALCPDHYIAQSPTVSVCTTSMYSNRPESGAPGAPGNTLPRLASGRSSGTSSSSFMEPPPDMPHAVAIVGQPFTYDHPALAALAAQSAQPPPPPQQFGRGGRNNLHAQQQPAPMFRFGIRRDQNSPTWITVDAMSGRLQGIPFAGDNGLGYVVIIMRWNAAVTPDGFSDPDSSFVSSGSRTVPPPHAHEAAKVWVSVSDAQMPAPRFAVSSSGGVVPQAAAQQRPPNVANEARIPPVPALVGTAIPVVQVPNLSPPPRVHDHPSELPKTPPPPQPPTLKPQRVVVTQVIPTTSASSTSQPLRPSRTNSTRLTVRRLNRATTATFDTDYEFNMAAGDDDNYSINSHRISEYFPVNVPGAQPMLHPIRSSIPNRPPTARGRQRSSSVSLDMPSYEDNSDDDPDATRHLRDLLKHRRSGSFDSVTREQWRASRRYTRSSDMDREDRERFEAWLRGERKTSTLMMGEFDYSGGGNMR